MKLSELGEFGLIERISEITGEAGDGELWIGDDSAVIRAPAGTLFFAADMMVERVHFDLELTGPRDLGYKAMAVNFSDIAAMGGTPRRAVCSLALRPELTVEWVLELYEGMQECASEFSAAVVGGDVGAAGCLVVSISVIGNPAGRRVIERKGARPGDLIGVTGVLGASAAGYRMLRAGDRSRPELLLAHLRPTPRVREAETLRRHVPTAMIDISDGFAADLVKLCKASAVGARVSAEKLPFIQDAGVDRTPMELALHGGEDYELCFTISPRHAEVAAAEVEKATGTPVTFVGEIAGAETGVLISIEGQESKLEGKGWDHLRA